MANDFKTIITFLQIKNFITLNNLCSNNVFLYFSSFFFVCFFVSFIHQLWVNSSVSIWFFFSDFLWHSFCGDWLWFIFNVSSNNATDNQWFFRIFVAWKNKYCDWMTSGNKDNYYLCIETRIVVLHFI